MKLKLHCRVLLFFIICSVPAASQSVGIGTAIPHISAQLDIRSTAKGVLIPRLTVTERNAIASPAKGLMVYDSTNQSFFYYNGTAWKSFKAAILLEDEDGDTKVQVEKNPNENILRVDLAGIERLTLKPGRLEFPNNDSNVYVGYLNGFTNTTGFRNTGIGNEALRQNQAGSFNTAVGFEANKLNNSGNWNTALGYQSLYSNLFGNGNIAVGSGGLYSNFSGNVNIAIGDAALYSNNTGSFNISIGSQSLIANTTGNNNIGIGMSALRLNTTRSNLIAIGDSALLNNGVGASSPSQSVNNVAIGSSSMKANTWGHENTAVGGLSLTGNTTGSNNSAFGHNSLSSNTTGSWNTGIGKNALWQNTAGATNTAIGYEALSGNTTGNGNTSIGYQSGTGIITGSNNTTIGYNANLGSSNLGNATAIGYGAVVNTSNALVLGNGARVGIGESSPLSALTIKKFPGADAALTIKGTAHNTVFITDDVTENVLIQAGKNGSAVILNPVLAGRLYIGGNGQGTETEVYGKMYANTGNGVGSMNIVPLGIIKFHAWEDNDYATSSASATYENLSGNLATSIDPFGGSNVVAADNLGCRIFLDPLQIQGYSNIFITGVHDFNASNGVGSNAYLTYKNMVFVPANGSVPAHIVISIGVDDFPNIGRCSTRGEVIVYGLR